MPKRFSSQKGFAPLVIIIVIALVVAAAVVVKNKMGSNSGYNSYNSPSYSAKPAASAKAATNNTLANVAQSSQSASPAPEVPVADYLLCPTYSGESAVAKPPFPAQGPAPLSVVLFAGGTAENKVGDSIAGFDWDFEGDNRWDNTVNLMGVQHSYTKVGTFTPKFRIRSVMGKVSKPCVYPHPVTVDKGQATTDPISVNSSNVTLNLSKANPNTTVMIEDGADYSSSGYLYGRAFNISLLKATGWQLTDKDETSGVMFDQSERTGLAGESFRVHVSVPASLANGSYKSWGKLQYFMDGTWHSFTTVTVTVNVTD